MVAGKWRKERNENWGKGYRKIDMNYSDRYLRQIATYSIIDVLLADVAIRIRLSPTDYQLTIDHLRDGNEPA